IGRWGHRFLDVPREDEFLSANAYLVAMRALFQPEAATDVDKTYELRVGNQVFEVRIADGCCTTAEGQPSSPDAILSMDVNALGALLGGKLSPAEALKTGRIRLEGEPDALV